MIFYPLLWVFVCTAQCASCFLLLYCNTIKSLSSLLIIMHPTVQVWYTITMERFLSITHSYPQTMRIIVWWCVLTSKRWNPTYYSTTAVPPCIASMLTVSNDVAIISHRKWINQLQHSSVHYNDAAVVSELCDPLKEKRKHSFSEFYCSRV